MLSKQLKQLKRKDKLIIITSYNTDFLLEVSDKIYAIDDNKILKLGNRYEILSDENLLSRIGIEIPDLIKFVNLVNRKYKNKLKNINNINDLIKDIYRNVKWFC